MRTNKLILLVGNRGTGKTDWTKDLIVQQMKLFPKVLIADSFDSDTWHNLQTFKNPSGFNIQVPIIKEKDLGRWRKGIARIFSSDEDQMLSAIEQNCKNTFLILEDATKYIGTRLTKKVRRFLIDSKQKNVDVVLVFHALAAVPPELVRIANILVLFKTSDGAISKEKYPWPEIQIMLEKLRKSENQYENLAFVING